MNEKLIELLASFSTPVTVNGEKISDWNIPMRQLCHKLADHLIANGVTVQDNTEITDELLKQLRNAPLTVLHEEPTIEVVQEWIPVKDRLPKGGAIVLCNTDYFVEVLQWDERSDMWVDQYRSYRKNYVTHWMPMPQPPKGE